MTASSRVSVVTGASAGIGLEIARGLARAGGTVVLVCRDAGRAEAARESIVRDTGNEAVEVVLADLSSQVSLGDAADGLTRRHPALDVLVNNAGVAVRKRELTLDGIERTFATNVLGYFLLTERLLPALRRAATARIVNVASMMAYDLDLDDVQLTRRAYDMSLAYAQSKQANRMLTWALARRLEGTSITANAMSPGAVETALLRKLIGGMKGRTPAEGADTAVWLATSPEVEGVTGRLFVDRQERRCAFRDPRTEDALWFLCERMTRAESVP